LAQGRSTAGASATPNEGGAPGRAFLGRGAASGTPEEGPKRLGVGLRGQGPRPPSTKHPGSRQGTRGHDPRPRRPGRARRQRRSPSTGSAAACSWADPRTWAGGRGRVRRAQDVRRNDFIDAKVRNRTRRTPLFKEDRPAALRDRTCGRAEISKGGKKVVVGRGIHPRDGVPSAGCDDRGREPAVRGFGRGATSGVIRRLADDGCGRQMGGATCLTSTATAAAKKGGRWSAAGDGQPG